MNSKQKILGSLGVAIFVVGCIVDHMTTMYGLNLYGIIETNILVRSLIELNLWHYVDFMLIIVCIVFFLVSMRFDSNGVSLLPSILFSGVGLIRFFAGVHNITIILDVLK